MPEKKQDADRAAHNGRELSITRLLDAPRELVFEVWTNPEHIKHWWGPNGFTNTIHSMDVRPDGVWDFIMHGPDGRDYKNKIIFHEIIRPERITYTHVTGPVFDVTVDFIAQDDKTLLTMRSVFVSAEQLTKVIKEFKADEGMKQNIDRLQAYLANM